VVNSRKVSKRDNPNIVVQWKAEGPFPLTDGQCEGTSNPNKEVTGAVNRVLPHPTDANILYVGSANGGLWKTTNAKASSPSWTPLTDHLSSLNVGALAFDTADTTWNTIVIGSGGRSSSGTNAQPTGVKRSTDGGTTWTEIAGMQGRLMTGIAASGNKIVASVGTALTAAGTFCANRGVFYTSDGGANWSQKLQGPAHHLVASPDDPNTIFTILVTTTTSGTCAGTAGVYKSTNAGQDWTLVSGGLAAVASSLNNALNAKISVAAASGAVVAAALTGTMQGIFYSSNGGTSWTALDIPSIVQGGVNVGLNPHQVVVDGLQTTNEAQAREASTARS